jgi:hypothetical protein
MNMLFEGLKYGRRGYRAQQRGGHMNLGGLSGMVALAKNGDGIARKIDMMQAASAACIPARRFHVKHRI